MNPHGDLVDDFFYRSILFDLPFMGQRIRTDCTREPKEHCRNLVHTHTKGPLTSGSFG